MKLIHKPYALKPSYVLTNSYWQSYTACDWFWSDDYLL